MADRGAIGAGLSALNQSGGPGTFVPNWPGASAGVGGSIVQGPAAIVPNWVMTFGGVGVAVPSGAAKWLPTWKGGLATSGSSGYQSVDTNGHLAGVVMMNGVEISNVWVGVYYRRGTAAGYLDGYGRLIARTKTDSLGRWSLYGFESNQACYTVIYHVPASLKTLGYNSMVLDNVKPE